MTKQSKIVLFAAATMMVMPLVTFASISIFPSGYWPGVGSDPPLLSCGAGGVPCVSLCNLLETAQRIAYFLITLLFFIGVPGFVIYGGFILVFSGGSPQKVGEGKKIITGAIIGAAIALGAFLIINTFLWLLGVKTIAQGGEVPWPTIECRVR